MVLMSYVKHLYGSRSLSETIVRFSLIKAKLIEKQQHSAVL